MPDVEIRTDSSPPLDSPTPDPGEYRLSVKDTAEFRIAGGSRISVLPKSGSVSRRLRLFLTRSAWGALLYQRGLLPLHAGAIQTESGAVLLCGRRGDGKSTLTAFLCDRGFHLITDDLCCTSAAGPEIPIVFPSVPRFKLWTDSIRELGWERTDSVPDQIRAEKLHYFRTARAVPEPQPLRSIYLLSWGELRIERVAGFTALNRLFRAGTWRGDLLMSACDPASHFRRCAELVRQAPIWEFWRPWDFRVLCSPTDAFVAHLTQNRTDSKLSPRGCVNLSALFRCCAVCREYNIVTEEG